MQKAYRLFIAFFLTILVITASGLSVSAIDYAALAEDPTEVVIEIEAEDFTPGAFQTAEDTSASGGKVLVSAAGERASYTLKLDDTAANFTLYAVHLAENRESALTYIAIDHMENYALYSHKSGEWNETRIYYSTVPAGEHTIYLDGARPGQKIDKFILKYEKAADEIKAVSLNDSMQALIDQNGTRSKLKVNNYRAKPDEEFVVTGDDIIVPATSVCELLGFRLEDRGDSYFVHTDFDYKGWLSFTIDSTEAKINGKSVSAASKSYKHEGVIPMVSLKLLAEAFGFDWEYEEAKNTVHIFFAPEEHFDFEYDYSVASEKAAGLHIITPGRGERTLRYTIHNDNPDAKVEVWIKYNLTDAQIFTRQNYDNMNALATGGYDYKRNGYSGWSYWQKATTPVFTDGEFVGSEHVTTIATYDIKVRITEDGEAVTYVMRNCPKPTGSTFLDAMTAKEYAYKTGGELLLVPTFENLSYYIDCADPEAVCDVVYREAGTTEWKKAFPPVYDAVVGQFRGSIVWLREGTAYEVKATIDGVEKTASVTTKTTDVPIAKTICLADIYSGEGTLLLRGLHGSEEGFIKVIGDGMTVDASNDTTVTAVLFDDCSFVILEDVTVRGGGVNGITVGDKCSDIRIVNCEVSEWGQELAYDAEFGRDQRYGLGFYPASGIFLMNQKNALVERCYIHDPRTDSNGWNSDTYESVHPQGSEGINQMGLSGNVIRYNDIVGSDTHRLNDAMTGQGNGRRNNSATGSDADVYGNTLMFSEDDGLEIDGGQMNVRVYQNRIEQTYCGISTAPSMMGPSYIYYNLIVNLGASYENRAGTALKSGGDPDGVFGQLHFIGNTVDSMAQVLVNINYSGKKEWHAYARNNIFVAANGEKSGVGNTYANERDDFDYNLVLGGYNIYNQDKTYVSPAGQTVTKDNRQKDEPNGIIKSGIPLYVSKVGGDYRLTEKSAGYGDGTWVDNFTEIESPNMGAFPDKDANTFMPFRPVDMQADKYSLRLKDGEVGEITVTLGSIGSQRSYSLQRSVDDTWLTIMDAAEDVPVSADSAVTFRIRGDLSECAQETGRSVVFFRLDDGLSIPVSVLVEPGEAPAVQTPAETETADESADDTADAPTVEAEASSMPTAILIAAAVVVLAAVGIVVKKRK